MGDDNTATRREFAEVQRAQREQLAAVLFQSLPDERQKDLIAALRALVDQDQEQKESQKTKKRQKHARWSR